MGDGRTANAAPPRRAAPPRGARGAPAGSSATLLLAAFHAFHAEVARERQLVARALGGGGSASDAVQQRLVDFLEAQAVAMTRQLAEHELRVYDEAQYVMVAMADEVFLHLDWPGRSAWAELPLEAHLFHTHDAGERLFRKLDDVLENRATASTALLLVYLAALALGFQGKFAALGALHAPETYRQRVARHLARIDPGLISAEQELCPEAHAHTVESAARTALPSTRNAYLPFVVVVICLLAVAQLLWSYQIAEVVEALDRIEDAS